MTIIKLNGEKMAKNKKQKKPTNQDFVNVINNIIQDMYSIKNRQDALEGTIDLYIEYKNNGKEFKEFIDSKLNIQQKEDNELSEAGQDNTVADKANTSN